MRSSVRRSFAQLVAGNGTTARLAAAALAALFVTTGARALGATPNPSPAPHAPVVFHLPTVPLHTEVVVEVNKKGQVVRVKSSQAEQDIRRSTCRRTATRFRCGFAIPTAAPGRPLPDNVRLQPEDTGRDASRRAHLRRRKLGQRPRRGQRHDRHGQETGGEAEAAAVARQRKARRSRTRSCHRSTKSAACRLPNRRP